MMDFNGLVDVVAQTFFGGDVTIAGLVIYSMVILVILALTRRAFITLLISLPITFIFTTLGWLPQEMVILLIIVAVLGMAMTSRNIWKD